MRKETCDSKQQRINDCGNGLGMLFLNEKEVTTKDIVQVATDEYSEKEVTRYQYDIEELRIDKAVTEANILEALIQKVAAKAEEYSDTSAVKSFTLLGAVTWFDKDKRASLVRRFEAEQATGETTTTIWVNGNDYQLPVTSAVDLMNQLEVYAAKCHDVTEQHKNKIAALTTIEDVCGYDYTAGYPTKVKLTTLEYKK